MKDTFVFSRQGRNNKTFVILGTIYSACIGAFVLLDATWWLMSGLSLLTIPALLDLWRNPVCGVRLSNTRLDWFSGQRKGTLALTEIVGMRFDTRLDFSVRVTAILMDKKRVRLPDETLPPHRQFETELQARGLTIERHHFRIL